MKESIAIENYLEKLTWKTIIDWVWLLEGISEWNIMDIERKPVLSSREVVNFVPTICIHLLHLFISSTKVYIQFGPKL